MTVFGESNRPDFTSRTDLLNTFDGDADFVHEMVLTFIDHLPLLLRAIDSALKAGDRTGVSHAAHSLKGPLGYFDHGTNRANASRLERITDAEMSRGPELLSRLQEGLAVLTRYLTEQFGSAAEETDVPQEIDFGPAN